MYPGPIRNQALDILFLFEATAVAFIQVMLPRYPGGNENAPLLSHGHENGGSEKIREKSSPIHQWKRGWHLAEHFENYSSLSHGHKNDVFSKYAEKTVFCQGASFRCQSKESAVSTTISWMSEEFFSPKSFLPLLNGHKFAVWSGFSVKSLIIRRFICSFAGVLFKGSSLYAEKK